MSDHALYCPSCGARFSSSATLPPLEKLLVLCGICGEISQAKSAIAPEVPAATADEVVEAQLPRVVVGHEQPAACRTLATVLRRGGFSPVCVSSGDRVLQACDPALPSPAVAAIVDVAIPGVLAFELVAQLREHPQTAAMPIVLLASVFERTRYKRRPTQLYGANAYLELHHVPDRLAIVLRKLMAGEPPGQDRHQAPADRAQAAPLRPPADVTGDDELRIYVRRLLSDIALYHGDEIATGIREGVPLAHLETAIAEAREKFTAVGGTKASATLFDEEVASMAERLLSRRRTPRAEAG